jgi:hypothetical protein
MLEFGAWLQATPFSVLFQTIKWLVPLVQSIHIVTIGLVFISSLMINLRVLGRMRADEPFPLVWGRFAPWMWGGLVVMTASGLLLVVSEPLREFNSLSFWIKMGLLAVGVIFTALLGRSLRSAAQQSRPDFSGGTKLAAVASVVLWLTIIFLGRAIAYDVEVWGTLSPHHSAV